MRKERTKKSGILQPVLVGAIVLVTNCHKNYSDDCIQGHYLFRILQSCIYVWYVLCFGNKRHFVCLDIIELQQVYKVRDCNNTKDI